MNIFLALLRRIFKQRLTAKERKEIIKRLKLKRNSYKIKRDGL